MKTRLLIFFLLLGAIACAQTFQVDTSEAEPWWEQVDENLALILKWVAALSVAFTALATAVFGAWMFIQSKLKEIRKSADEKMDALDKRQDRFGEEKRDLQRQITEVAIATDPTKTSGGRPAVPLPTNRPTP